MMLGGTIDRQMCVSHMKGWVIWANHSFETIAVGLVISNLKMFMQLYRICDPSIFMILNNWLRIKLLRCPWPLDCNSTWKQLLHMIVARWRTRAGKNELLIESDFFFTLSNSLISHLCAGHSHEKPGSDHRRRLPDWKVSWWCVHEVMETLNA